MKKCPKCQQDLLQAFNFYICPLHGQVNPEIENLGGISLPFPIAVSIHDYQRDIQRNEYFYALHRLCDVAEVVARFFAVVTLSQIRTQNNEHDHANKEDSAGCPYPAGGGASPEEQRRLSRASLPGGRRRPPGPPVAGRSPSPNP